MGSVRPPMEISIAALRLFYRASVIKGETKERVEEEDMNQRIDHAIKNKIAPLNYVPEDEEERLADLVAAALAQDSEYLNVKAELRRLLQLGPRDTNPLDLKYDQEWTTPDDPRVQDWLRAAQLNVRLTEAMIDWITGRWAPITEVD
jgi:hypothetical protein